MAALEVLTTLAAPVLVSVRASAAGDAVCVQLLVAILLILPVPEFIIIVPALKLPPAPVIAELLEISVIVPAAAPVPTLIPLPPIDKPAPVEVRLTEVVPLTVSPLIEIAPGALTATVVPVIELEIPTVPLVVVIETAPSVEIGPLIPSIVTGPAALRVTAPVMFAPNEIDAVPTLVMLALLVPEELLQENDGVETFIG